MSEFSRGFLLARSPVPTPEAFVEGPIFPHFFVGPGARVQWAGDTARAVVVIGTCLPTDAREQDKAPAEALLEALREGIDNFTQLLGRLAGSFTVIFGHVGDIRVAADATAMSSLFYARRGGLVASHAELVSRALGQEAFAATSPYRHGFPGLRTPFPHVRMLTAGTSVDLDRPHVRRLWPSRPVRLRSPEEAAEQLAQAATTALEAALDLGPVWTELAAGPRGRAVLACLASVPGDRRTFSLADPEVPAEEVREAQELRLMSGLPHEVLGDADRGRYPLLAWGGGSEPHLPAKNVTTEVMEGRVLLPSTLTLGKLAAEAAAHLTVQVPLDAESMLACHRFPADSDDEQTPLAVRTSPEAWTAFNEYADTSGLAQVSGLVRPFDQFLWEHRLAAWHAGALEAWDRVAESFCIFNAFESVELLLGVRREHRRADSVLDELARSLLPGRAPLPERASRPTDAHPLEPGNFAGR